MWGRLVLYVGKTTQTLRKRESKHRSIGNRSHSKYIPDDIDWEMVLLEECEDNIAISREQYYYDTLKPFYNNNRPGQTPEEYRQTEAGKEAQRESERKYRQTDAGKESRREYQKRYYAKKKARESSA